MCIVAEVVHLRGFLSGQIEHAENLINDVIIEDCSEDYLFNWEFVKNQVDRESGRRQEREDQTLSKTLAGDVKITH